MEMYKKPIMKIVELEKVDVLTASGTCPVAGCGYSGTGLNGHIAANHSDYTPDNP